MANNPFKKTVIPLLLLPLFFSLPCRAGEPEGPFTAGADLVSSFVWRGSRIGKGPAIQPTVEFSAGGFVAGAWGSYYLANPEIDETDLYVHYTFKPGIRLGVNDYYFTSLPFFTMRNHALELSCGFERGGFSLAANYIVNEGAGAAGGDTYFEAGYATGSLLFFIGAGDGWHTTDYRFALCNVGMSVTREIRITESFSLPLTGSVILNPESQKLFIVAGITL